MNPTGGHTGLLSPDAVKVAIEGIAWEEFTRESQPGYLSATDPFFFKQENSGYANVYDVGSNVGAFEKTCEQEVINNTNTLIGNTVTKFSQKYTKQIPISDEAFRDDRHNVRAQLGRQVGDRARYTVDKFGILESYGDAFAGSVNTTDDSVALASNSHVTLGGYTVDNLETGSLTPDNLWTCTVSLAGQRAQDAELGSHVFEGLVLPFLLFKTGKEVMNSQLLANSGENNINVFDTDYGEVRVAASTILGSAYNSATNANTSYHLVGRNHQIVRHSFYGLVTSMLSPEQTTTDSYVMRYKFNERTYPKTWTAYVGSNGSAAS